MEDATSQRSTHHPWYTRPGPLGLAVFLIIFGGASVGLVLRAYQNVVTNTHLQFTDNPSANVALPSSAAVNRELLTGGNDPSLGPSDAEVVVVEFGDFQCPYCREVFPTIRRLMNAFSGRVRFVFRDYPVSDAHPLAQTAAEAGMCAWEQGANQFWAFHDRLYVGQDSMTDASIRNAASLSGVNLERFSTCLNSGTYREEVLDDLADGIALGVRGTPTFFINGEKYEGVLDEATFRDILNQKLRSVSH